MFHLGIRDHVRLNFGSALKNYMRHAQAAERLSTLTFRVRVTVLALVAAAATAAVIAVMTSRSAYNIATAAAAGLAFVAFAVYLAVDFETRVFAHRSCAHRMWIVCERHRALIAEMEEGLLDNQTLLDRCGALASELHAVYEQPFAASQRAFEAIRQAPEETPSDAPPSDQTGHPVMPADQTAPPLAQAVSH